MAPTAPERAADVALSRLERRVKMQAALLREASPGKPLPAEVLALLACAPTELEGVALPAKYVPRLVALHDQIAAMVEDITLRQRDLGGRLARVRAVRRPGPVTRGLDYRS